MMVALKQSSTYTSLSLYRLVFVLDNNLNKDIHLF